MLYRNEIFIRALSIWTCAIRPKTLFASISPVLLGSVLAFSSGHFSLCIFLCTLLTALGIQISTNFVNDYCDYLKGADTEHRKGPVRITQSGLVSLSTMRKAILLALGLTMTFGLYLILQEGLFIAVLLVIALILAILYTAGPFPLAYIGLGDLFVFIFFGPVAVLGTYFLQTHFLSWEGLWIGVGSGALSTAILCINNLRDIEEDRKAHKKTLAVRLGKTFAKMEYLACLLLAIMMSCLIAMHHPYVLLSSLFFLPALSCIKATFCYQDPRELNAVLAKTGQLLLLYTVLFSLGWFL